MKLIEELCKNVRLTDKQLKKLRDAGFISERFYRLGNMYYDDDVDPADYFDEQGLGHYVIEGVGEVWVTDDAWDWYYNFDWDIWAYYHYHEYLYDVPKMEDDEADIPTKYQSFHNISGQKKQRLFEGKQPQKLTAPELNDRLPEIFFGNTEEKRFFSSRLFQLFATLAAVCHISGNKYDTEKAIRHFCIPDSAVDKWNVFVEYYEKLEHLTDSELTSLLIKALNSNAKLGAKTCDLCGDFMKEVFIPLCKDNPLWDEGCLRPYQGPAVNAAQAILNEPEQIAFTSGKHGWILKHKNVDFLDRMHRLRNRLANLCIGIMMAYGEFVPPTADSEGKITPAYINLFGSCRLDDPELIRKYLHAGINRINDYTWRLKEFLQSPDFMISTPLTKTKNKLQIKKLLRTAGGCKWDLLTGSEWAKLLTCCPDFSHKCSKWEEFTGENWSLLLINQPQLADKCDWEKLGSEDWFKLLRAQPQFADKCDWEKFDKDELARLLTEQLAHSAKGDHIS
ncbi:MAG: hypothetical protein IJW08_00280 [Lentisphaeria bacterium]|nr:hypothetical protein [Lentisphaeria bacterium]